MSTKVKEKGRARTTINLPEKAHVSLSRMVLRVRAQGKRMYKQDLCAAMIRYFDKKPQLLKEIAV